jgi:hypothetical protein
MATGPWLDEPDVIEWQYELVPCFMVRHAELGMWCGYVAVEEGHPWYEQGYDDVLDDVEVHGGLTYARDKVRLATGVEGRLWWLGFDCGHCGDLCPGYPGVLGALNAFGDVYRDRAYVVEQVEHLARQALRANFDVAARELIALLTPKDGK